jgi:ABC-type nitrate/sulfonate/bicarbonate transport system permease component
MIALYRLLALAAFLLAWWIAATYAGTAMIPSPGETLAAARSMAAEGRLWTALGESLTVYGSGYLLAIAAGVPLGLLMGGFRPFGRTLDIYVNALTATPRVAFIPLIIVLLGLGYEAKVAIVFLGAVMPIVINTYAGVLNADGELVEMARASGATRPQIFRRILLPGALPFIVVGLRLGATIGLINTVVAELYTAVRGLGGLLAIYGNTFQMAPYFVVVFVLAAIGTLVTTGLRLIEVRTERWRYDGNG